MNKEIKIMYTLNFPYIIKLYNHFEEEDKIYLVIEYALGVNNLLNYNSKNSLLNLG